MLPTKKTGFFGNISVTTSSDGLIFVKRRAKDGRSLSKTSGISWVKFKFCLSLAAARPLHIQSVIELSQTAQ